MSTQAPHGWVVYVRVNMVVKTVVILQQQYVGGDCCSLMNKRDEFVKLVLNLGANTV